MENSHHLSPTPNLSTLFRDSPGTGALLVYVQPKGWLISFSTPSLKRHRRSWILARTRQAETLQQDRAALIPPTVPHKHPLPGLPEASQIRYLNLLSSSHSRSRRDQSFLRSFYFLDSNSVVFFFFFFPLPFIFPQFIRKSQDSSRFFCPKHITFTNSPNQDVTSPDFKSVSTAWITLYGVQGVEHDMIPGMVPEFLVVVLLESHTWNIPCTWEIHGSDASSLWHYHQHSCLSHKTQKYSRTLPFCFLFP